MKSGVIHLGFSAWLNTDTNAILEIQAYNDYADNNPNRFVDDDAELTRTNILRCATAIKDSMFNVTDKNDTKWHRYDLYLDWNRYKIYCYVDGVSIGETALNFGVKALRIVPGNTEMRLDDLYIRHFKDGDENTKWRKVNEEDRLFDHVEMIVDCPLDTTTGKDNNVIDAKTKRVSVRVSFSEYVDTTIKGWRFVALDGEQKGEAFNASHWGKSDDASRYYVSFAPPYEGNYRVEYIGTTKGMISDMPIYNGETDFATSGAEAITPAADTGFYVNDFRLFETIEGGTAGNYNWSGATIPVSSNPELSVTQIAENDYKLMVKGENNTGINKSVTVIFAGYTEGQMTNVIMETLDGIEPGEFTKEIAFGTETGEVNLSALGGDSVKCFVWQGTDSIIPLNTALDL